MHPLLDIRPENQEPLQGSEVPLRDSEYLSPSSKKFLVIPENQKPLRKPDIENNSAIKMFGLMHKKLFLDNIQSCNYKHQLEHYIKPKPTKEALRENFIRYGTIKATSFLIIDIDKIEMDIREYEKKIKEKLGTKPTWIAQTNRGFHVGFILDKPVYLLNGNEKKEEQLRETKKNLTNILGADVAGSHKLIGYWRNPLEHKSIININVHSLDKLYELSCSRNNNNKSRNNNNKSNKSNKSKMIKINKEDFIKGNRNNFLFNKTVGLLYIGQINNDQVHETLTQLNQNELEQAEINKIANSIKRYNIQPNKNKNKNIKIRSYEKGEYNDDLWKHKIHNFEKNNKIVYNRQKIGQKITTAKIIKNTIDKLIKGCTLIYKNNEKFSNKNIVENSNVSKSTVKRYRNVRKMENAIRSIAFMESLEYLKYKEKEGVKADEPPCKKFIKFINSALSKLNFIDNQTGYTYAFKINDKEKLIFYRLAQEIDQYTA